MSEQVTTPSVVPDTSQGVGGPGNGDHAPPGNAWDRFPTPAGVRAVLVRILAAAGQEGLTDVEAERAVASQMPHLEDPLDADIESLLLLGVLTRVDADRLAVTPLAAEYIVGAKVSV